MSSEDEMAGWHHQCNGREIGQTSGDGEGQGDAGKDLKQEEKGMTEDEVVGWHHLLDGHEFEQAPGVSDGQGSLVCCSPWGHRKSDMTE